MFTKEEALHLKSLWQNLNESSPITYFYKISTFSMDGYSFYVYLDGIEIASLIASEFTFYDSTERVIPEDIKKASLLDCSDGSTVSEFYQCAKDSIEIIEDILSEKINVPDSKLELFACIVAKDFSDFYHIILTPQELQRCSKSVFHWIPGYDNHEETFGRLKKERAENASKNQTMSDYISQESHSDTASSESASNNKDEEDLFESSLPLIKEVPDPVPHEKKRKYSFAVSLYKKRYEELENPKKAAFKSKTLPRQEKDELHWPYECL